MSGPIDKNSELQANIRKSWRNWLLLYVPAMALTAIANIWLDFSTIVAASLVLLCATLIYQRYVNKRSWDSILWGNRGRRTKP